MDQEKFLIVIVGPTAVGKTSLSIKLAQQLETEIISADSRQFYREMSIGTAKPSEEQLIQVKHYLINTLSVFEDYDVGQFEVDALNILNKIWEQKPVAILTGGSGLYIKAVCEGFDDLPSTSPETRKLLNERYQMEGLDQLREELKKVDPEYYNEVDLMNPQRIIRALEVIQESGKPFSSFRKGVKQTRNFEIIKIGLELPREELYDRIDQRMDLMIQDGLFEEAEALLKFKNKNALQTVGYKEIFDFLEGNYDKEEAIRLLKRNSRRYAKRQLTWFKKDLEIEWFHPDQSVEIIDFVKEVMGNR